jgi:hypothetical protein
MWPVSKVRYTGFLHWGEAVTGFKAQAAFEMTETHKPQPKKF